MEISQITGAGKDPVANVKEDQHLKSIGAIPAVPLVKKDGDARQSTPEQQHDPSFEHLRQEPLQLLVRVLAARLQQTFGVTPAPRPLTSAIEQTLTPELACARILLLLNAAFANYKTAQPNQDQRELGVIFINVAHDTLQQGYAETRQLLGNLAMLEGIVVKDIDKTIALIDHALPDISAQR